MTNSQTLPTARKCIGQWLCVKFDPDHNRVLELSGGQKLIMADQWLHKDDEGKQTFQENLNHLESKPQICTVLIENEDYPYKVGDKLCVHYMAWETSKNGDIVTNEAIIIADYVFFKILPNGDFEMADGIYLGKQVYTEEQKTASGIIFDLGQKKENLKVKITHIPKDMPERNGEQPVHVGDTVISIDKYNYELTIYPDKYVKLTKDEIAGTLIDSKLTPLAL